MRLKDRVVSQTKASFRFARLAGVIIDLMSVKAILSWVTLGLVVLIIFFSRHELVHAWKLLQSIDLAILWLLIPMQLLAYYAAGETLFAYLRSSRKTFAQVSRLELARLALELNFVNHVLPSGGVSGLSYMSWRLGKFGVTPGRATAAQAVRYVAGFIASIILILVSVIVVTIDGSINRWIILVSAGIVSFMIFGTLGMIFLVSNQIRMERFAHWLVTTLNHWTRKLTRGKKRVIVHEEPLLVFFNEMHEDYMELQSNWRILTKPLLWALLFTIAEASLFAITFWALGTPVNPAPILIAYCLASVAGFIVVTPGGAGAYEAIMVAFLAVAGISSGVAIAGIVLSRVVILLTTIGFGYIFYQQTLLRYGRRDKPPVQR